MLGLICCTPPTLISNVGLNPTISPGHTLGPNLLLEGIITGLKFFFDPNGDVFAAAANFF